MQESQGLGRLWPKAREKGKAEAGARMVLATSIRAARTCEARAGHGRANKAQQRGAGSDETPLIRRGPASIGSGQRLARRGWNVAVWPPSAVYGKVWCRRRDRPGDYCVTIALD